MNGELPKIYKSWHAFYKETVEVYGLSNMEIIVHDKDGQRKHFIIQYIAKMCIDELSQQQFTIPELDSITMHIRNGYQNGIMEQNKELLNKIGAQIRAHYDKGNF